MSPTVLKVGSYRVVIYTLDHPPAHVHVISASRIAKFSLDPVLLLDNAGYLSRELRKIERIIIDNQPLLLDAWNEIHRGTE
ncbi:DUF4160 domain-containing protein [Aggregatilinea lenta]|uniref:DUF4160 domain-containing protein n=1 Tax=Aggregatilinea lenta TaxID=913108 RepID=UPI000E5B22C5|nr:DUF4160 domain-containing protein [Aggregatilinea lenta]